MSRISSVFLRTLFLAGAVIIFILGFAVASYAFYLNIQITRTMADHQWRTPTEIVSAPTGRIVARVYGTDWRATPPVILGNIPSWVPDAFLAAEDVRFRNHFGVDPIGMARALFTDLRHHQFRQGGSTIDQQLIKMKFLSNERTIRRKFIEVLMAIVLDLRFSKDEILEAYLNDVYLGHVNGKAVLGVDEAARVYLGKTPAQLTPDEAALIAGIIRAPNRDTPDRNPDVALVRRNAVLRVMNERGWISDDELARSRQRPVNFFSKPLPRAPFPYYLSALRTEVIQRTGAGTLFRSGLKIVAEIDPSMQTQAERAAANGTADLKTRYSWIRNQSRHDPLEAAILSVSPSTGGIRALVGGADFQVSPLDRTLYMHRQPGSAFKTFAYLSAIESRRFTNSTLLLDAPVKIALEGDRFWQPENYDERYRGRVTMREAFEESLNVPTVRMAQEVGTRKIIRTIGEFGFEETFEEVPALPLGVVEVTIRELTGAYTSFPNLGQRVEPYLLAEIRDHKDRTIYRHKVKREAVIDPAAAYVVHSLLRGVVRRGTASRLRRYGLGNVAGKTGTTSDYRDAWFVGYTVDLVTTVWVGFDRGAPLRLSSSVAAIPIWGTYMKSVRTDGRDIPAPAGVILRDIDPETGFLWRQGCPGPLREVYLSGTEPTRRCPTGFFGNIARRVFFERDTFDEPPAITFEKFRQFSTEIEQGRQAVEGRLQRFRDFIRGKKPSGK